MNLQSARVYAVSTASEVGKLGAPVVLEGPPVTLQAGIFELVADHWQRSPVSAGQTPRVEISGFSTRTFAFLDGAADTLNTALTVLEAVQSVRAPATPGLQKGSEADQRALAENGDAATRSFYGVGETASRTQSAMCDEIRSVLEARKGKAAVRFPKDYGATSYPSLGLFLFEAGTPKGAGYYWDLTNASIAGIESRVLAQNVARDGPLSLARVLDAAIEANGGDVALGVLAAHNYLKEKAYNGRDQGKTGGVGSNIADPISRIETWRRSGSTNPAGEYDKVGPLYHVFAAMTAGVWGPTGLGQTARTGEALLRSFGIGDDTPDVEKGAADQCGAQTASWILENLNEGEIQVRLSWTSRATERCSLCNIAAGSPKPMDVAIYASTRDSEDRINENVPGGIRTVALISPPTKCESDSSEELRFFPSTVKAFDAGYSGTDIFLWAFVDSNTCAGLLGDVATAPRIAWRMDITLPDGSASACAGEFVYWSNGFDGPKGQLGARIDTAGRLQVNCLGR